MTEFEKVKARLIKKHLDNARIHILRAQAFAEIGTQAAGIVIGGVQ